MTAGGVQVNRYGYSQVQWLVEATLDGQHKKWTLDQFGRLGLTGGEEG